MLLLKAAIYQPSFTLFPETLPPATLNMALMMLYVKSQCVALREVSFTPAYAGDALIAE